VALVLVILLDSGRRFEFRTRAHSLLQIVEERLGLLWDVRVAVQPVASVLELEQEHVQMLIAPIQLISPFLKHTIGSKISLYSSPMILQCFFLMIYSPPSKIILWVVLCAVALRETMTYRE
jgi:hypothetical protein